MYLERYKFINNFHNVFSSNQDIFEHSWVSNTRYITITNRDYVWIQGVQVSVQFSCSVVSDSLRPHGLWHIRPPYPSPAPRTCSNSLPLSWWCHPTISSSVVPFSSCIQSFPTSGSFSMSQLFASGSQSIGISTATSVLPMNIQDWFPLGLTGWISLQSKGLWRVF